MGRALEPAAATAGLCGIGAFCDERLAEEAFVVSWPASSGELCKFLLTAASMILFLVIVACSNPPGRMETIEATREGTVAEDFYINSQLVECEGVAPQQCMQVRKSPDEDWELFYGRIEGFTFEPGYAYKVRVRVTPVEQAPADASTLRYTLLEVEEKIRA
ncbi:MAG TPA: DUF4377 domain-containing protein [Kineosporiaceae bacterium]|nr:DUF4377 domain-containing protein [Kineosporiaceae bacterium]